MQGKNDLFSLNIDQATQMALTLQEAQMAAKHMLWIRLLDQWKWL